MVTKLTAAIDAFPKDSDEFFLYSFCLAAFVQFHFVDLHPFIDGNGRMGQFLGNYFLDLVCPISFPMFLQQGSYVQALQRSWNEKPLTILLLDCAILLS